LSKKTYGYYLDPNRPSSGARFYRGLCERLRPYSKEYNNRPDVVLFNMSSPIGEILKCKLRGQKIVLRVDGLWFDSISKEFLVNISTIFHPFIRILGKFEKTKEITQDVINLAWDNYKSFIKIYFADYVIYQSDFSKILHNRYFPEKQSKVILNASPGMLHLNKASYVYGDEVRICQIYSDAPFKGIYESIKFVKWLNEKKGIPAKLYLVGYSGNLPPNAPSDMECEITNQNFVIAHPEFECYDESTSSIVSQCHFYLCLSRRDPCPNAVIECMSMGLPVVGIASGGVTEIVGDAGELINWNDWGAGFFQAQRYEFINCSYDFEALYAAMFCVLNDLKSYCEKVDQRFQCDLDMDFAANKYKDYLEDIARITSTP
jgi:glycosyltransferase involved in cell wall biosynthesis